MSNTFILGAAFGYSRVNRSKRCIEKPSSWKNRASHSLILKADSTPLAERTPSRAVCKIRSFCVSDGGFQLFLECLDLAGKMRFPLFHRKGLETPANTHQFNSVS